ncbi:MAG: tryptophan synthase subunit alpha [Raineya sp.]
MNRIEQLFQRKKANVLSIYCTAGFPKKDATLPILEALASSGVDLIEIGMPFSDPLADGETIQRSSEIALENGMSLQVLFEQLQGVRQKISLPLVLMGYLNPVLQFGVENFCKKCAEVGIDGLILPDLPLQEYEEQYKALFEQYQLSPIFLITPQTSEARIRRIDSLSKGFIYVVSQASTTGAKAGISNTQEQYFERIRAMQLQNPLQIGFGIADAESFQKACSYAQGAIIGSAFIRYIQERENFVQASAEFVASILKN